jgi:hypothetical protein
MRKINKWIQKARPKKGVLSKQLGIPKEKNIPMSLLNKIIKSKVGEKVINPTMVGNKVIKITSKLERRAILARNLKNIKRR